MHPDLAVRSATTLRSLGTKTFLSEPSPRARAGQALLFFSRSGKQSRRGFCHEVSSGQGRISCAGFHILHLVQWWMPARIRVRYSSNDTPHFAAAILTAPALV